MRVLGLVVLFCIGFASWAFASLEQGPDLPPVGSSLFDKIFSQGSQYDVPYPIGRLTQKLNQLDADLVHTLLPFSRSLQRPHDLSYDPLLNPRLVLTSLKDHASITRGQLYLGYVKAKDQLEVISYNDEAGRFEFQIVTDYSRNPRVYYVNRGKCVSCHQAQAPIFSTPSWSDTSLGVMGEMITTKLGLGSNSASGRREATRQLFGELGSDDNAAVFDFLVRAGAQLAVDDRVWKEGCGSDLECRLGLLLHTLAPRSNYTEKAYAHAQKVIASSGLRDQFTFNSALPDTSLGVRDLVRKHGSMQAVVNSPAALLEIISSLYNLGPNLNPATPRPLLLSGRDLTGPLSGFRGTEHDLLLKVFPNQDSIAVPLRKLLSTNPSLFSGAIQKNRIMHALLKEAGSPTAEDYAHWFGKPTPRKELFEGPLPPLFRQRELNLFSRHCASCHASGSAYPPQFLLGTEEQVVRHVSALREKILAKLEAGLMPPNPADREVLRASGDLAVIAAYLKGLR
jgi:hypothetical protein